MTYRILLLPLLFLLLLPPAASARSFYCTASQDSEPERLLQWGDLLLEQVRYGGRCHFRIGHDHTSRPTNFRDFSFSEEGEIFIYAQFHNPHNPHSTFATSGTKGYYLLPRIATLRAHFDQQAQRLQIRLPSGERVYFRNNPVAIDEVRTSDLEIRQQPVTFNNAAGIALRNPRGILLNLGYRPGGSEEITRNLQLEDRHGNRCALPHRSLFDYYRNHYRITPGPCPAELTSDCRCADRHTSRERTICGVSNRLATADASSRTVDSYRIKADIENLIERQCPQLARLDRTPIIDPPTPAPALQLALRPGHNAPPQPRRPPASSRQRSSNPALDGLGLHF